MSEGQASKSSTLASERTAGSADFLWWLFHTADFYLVVISLAVVIQPFRKLDDTIFFPVYIVSAVVYHFLVQFWYLAYINEPDKCLGKVGKSIIEVISVTAVVAIREFSGYKISYLLTLVGFTAHFHVILQFRRVAYDISMWDVLWGSLMQIAVYMMGGHIYLLIVGVVLCGGVVFYRAITYSSPIVPVQEQGNRVEE